MRRMFAAKVVAFAVIAVMCGATLVAWPEPASAQEDTVTACASELSLTVPSDEGRGKTPVLFVHGYTGKPSIWTDGENSMAESLSIIDDLVIVEPFDYESENTEWIASSGAAHNLAKSIVCYNQLYGKKVVVVAHSMGGLLAAEAFDWASFGVFVKDAGGHLITIGSPYEGSWLAAGLNTGDMSFCTVLTGGNVDLCRDVYAEQATSGLSIDSDQLAALPELPDSITHKAIAGQVNYQVCFFACAELDLGDLVVPIDSATARSTDTGAGDGVTVFGCTLSGGVWCSHGAMLQAEQVQQEVKASIEAYLSSQPKMIDFYGLQLPIDEDDWLVVTPETSEYNWAHADEGRTVAVDRDCVIDNWDDQGISAPAYCPGFAIVNMNAPGYEELPYGSGDECGWPGLHDDTFVSSPRETKEMMIGGVRAIRQTHWYCEEATEGDYRQVVPSANPSGVVLHSWLIPSENMVVFDFRNDSPGPLPGLEGLLASASWS